MITQSYLGYTWKEIFLWDLFSRLGCVHFADFCANSWRLDCFDHGTIVPFIPAQEKQSIFTAMLFVSKIWLFLSSPHPPTEISQSSTANEP